MHRHIEESIQKTLAGIHHLQTIEGRDFLEKAAKMLQKTLEGGGKVLIAGNGGSLAEAIHFAEELTGRYRKTRRPFAAIPLADASHITCTTNDMGFDEIFSRPVEAMGKPEDLFIALSTSGNSKNIIRAVEAAKKQKMATLALLGKSGGPMKGMCDLEWIVSDLLQTADRIQEVHLLILHLIIDLFEHYIGCA